MNKISSFEESSLSINQSLDESSIGSIEIQPKLYQICSAHLHNFIPTPKIEQPQQTQIIEIQEERRLTSCKSKSTFHNLVVRMNLHKFKQKMVERKNAYKKLNINHFKLLGDKSYDLDQAPPAKEYKDPYLKQTIGSYYIRKMWRRINKWQRILNHSKLLQVLDHKVERIMAKVPLFDGDSRANVLWQILITFIQIFFIITLPIEVAFNNHLLSKDLANITFTFVLLLWLDFIVRLNTIYIKFGEVFTRRTQIFLNNVKEGLITDAVSVSILSVILLQNYVQSDKDRNPYSFLLLIYLTQLSNILKEKQRIEESVDWSIEFKQFYGIMNVMIAIIFVEHLYACIWSWIGLIEYDNYNRCGWIQKFSYRDIEWEYLYIDAFYFTTVTLISVGYGDITPQTPTEKIVSVIFMFLSTLQLSYSLQKVGQALEDLSRMSQNALNKMRAINHYMKRQGISLHLRNRVTEYLSMYWREKFYFDQMDQENIIRDLSDSLREQLMQEATINMVQKIKFVNDNFSRWFKLELSQVIQQVNISPEGLIELFDANDPQNSFLYYIDEGLVEEVINVSSKSEAIPTQRILLPGQSFGVQSFISGQQISISYKSKGFGKLFKLQRSQFLEILKEYPVDYEKFCMIKDQYIEFSQIQNIEEPRKCLFCRAINHHVLQCRSLHYIPDREKIIKSFQFYKCQRRNPNFQREQVKKANSLFHKKTVFVDCKNFEKQIEEQNPYSKLYQHENNEKEQALTKKDQVKRTTMLDPSQRLIAMLATKGQSLVNIELELWAAKIDSMWRTSKDFIKSHFNQRDVNNLKILRLKLLNLTKVKMRFVIVRQIAIIFKLLATPQY